jgi:hypothetical protein
MPDPPDPGFPAALLASAAILGFLAFTHAPDGTPMGTFQDQFGRPVYLVVAGGGGVGSGAWTLVSPVPPGFAGHLMSRNTYDVIHAGVPSPDGSGALVYKGTAYSVSSLWNNPGHEARAVPV